MVAGWYMISRLIFMSTGNETWPTQNFYSNPDGSIPVPAIKTKKKRCNNLLGGSLKSCCNPRPLRISAILSSSLLFVWQAWNVIGNPNVKSFF
jgi:hypothetical protein